MRRAIDAFTTTINVIAGAAIIVLMALTAWEVSRRLLFNISWAGLIEYSEVVLVILFYLSMAAALRSGAHIQVESVYRYLPRRLRGWMEVLGLTILLVFLLMLLWQTTGRAIESFLVREYRMGLARVPIWPARAVIPIGLLAFNLQLLLRIIDRIGTARQGGEPGDPVPGPTPTAS